MKKSYKRALRQIVNGADMYSYQKARLLREIEEFHPEYIEICEPQKYNGDGTDQMPYFGTICTSEGLVAIGEDPCFPEDII